jgi:hypothetical protein
MCCHRADTIPEFHRCFATVRKQQLFRHSTQTTTVVQSNQSVHIVSSPKRRWLDIRNAAISARPQAAKEPWPSSISDHNRSPNAPTPLHDCLHRLPGLPHQGAGCDRDRIRFDWRDDDGRIAVDGTCQTPLVRACCQLLSCRNLGPYALEV